MYWTINVIKSDCGLLEDDSMIEALTVDSRKIQYQLYAIL